MPSKRAYILYDSRTCGAVGTDDATVLVFCDSNKEAKSYKGEYGIMACYSYEMKDNTLQDEKWEWDYQNMMLKSACTRALKTKQHVFSWERRSENNKKTRYFSRTQL